MEQPSDTVDEAICALQNGEVEAFCRYIDELRLTSSNPAEFGVWIDEEIARSITALEETCRLSHDSAHIAQLRQKIERCKKYLGNRLPSSQQSPGLVPAVA